MVADDHRQRAETALTVLDTNLAGRLFITAPEPTIADLCCYGEVAFATICQFEMSRWTHIADWAGRIAMLPGFKAPFDLLTMADAEVS